MSKTIRLVVCVILIISVLSLTAFQCSAVKSVDQSVVSEPSELTGSPEVSLAGADPVAEASVNRILGDTDADRNVTIIDVTWIQMYLASLKPLDVFSQIAADVDGNDEVEIVDVSLIQMYLASMEIPYKAGENVNTYADEKNKALKALLDRYHEAREGEGIDDDTPVLMRSYDTAKVELENSAYVYDNALCAIVFMKEGYKKEAQQILDAFSYAAKKDRWKAGVLRNAYAAGDIRYNGSVKLPGWYDGKWIEDQTQVGSYTGNVSYAALAMLHYDDMYDTDKYLDTVIIIMDQVIDEYSGEGPGFLGGFEGWPEDNPKAMLKYRSTEHNLDAYTVFSKLYRITGDKKYLDASESAFDFVKSMYDENLDLFYMGTDDKGDLNKSVIVLDAQVWGALSLQEKFKDYERSLELVDSMKLEDGGYPFCQENRNGGYWCEGTAFTALMFSLRNDMKKFKGAMDPLSDIQYDSGLLPSASVDNLYTGIIISTGDWEYNRDPHVASTSWLVLSYDGFNPYVLK